MFGKLNIDLCSICIIWRCIVGVQNTGLRNCWENRRWSSAATGSAATIWKKTSSCILTRRATRTRKLMKVAHNVCKSIAIWLKTTTAQYTWFGKGLYNYLSHTNFCWSLYKIAISVMRLWEFTSPNTFSHHWRYDVAFTSCVTFRLKDLASSLSQWAYFQSCAQCDLCAEVKTVG